MNTKFSHQRDDQPLRDTSEASAVSAAEVESREPGFQATSTAANRIKGSWRWPGTFVRAAASQDYIGVLVAIVVLTLGIGILHPDFLLPAQLLDILNQATFVAILACGMAFLLAMRELDLSAGSTYGLTSLCAALLMHSGLNSWLGASIAKPWPLLQDCSLSTGDGFYFQMA
ncbi:MAG TPA: hypothetical protein VFN35_18355, partial [Ktedonobacteraceae bacterium]|nr:hypothetical protein [Ktedonobacteraceae bacterium]